MRKFLLAAAAGLLVAPALASAQDPGYEVPSQPAPEMPQPAEPGIEQPGELGQFETEPGVEVRTAQEEHQQVQQQSRQLFQGKVKTWDLEGTVTSVDPTRHEITIQRENLPDAHLALVDDTKITLDGKQATMQELQEGAEVRAKFQLAEGTPVAVSLDAKPSKEQKKMQEQPMPQDSGSMGGGMQR